MFNHHADLMLQKEWKKTRPDVKTHIRMRSWRMQRHVACG
jgi:hypothetical protein